MAIFNDCKMAIIFVVFWLLATLSNGAKSSNQFNILNSNKNNKNNNNNNKIDKNNIMITNSNNYRNENFADWSTKGSIGKNDENENEDSGDYVTVASSCADLDDGLRYIQPMEDNVVIPVICNNGFAMMDPALNFDVLTENYFSSIKAYGDSADRIVYSPDCSEGLSWREWFLAANEKTQFLLSMGCSGTCTQSSDSNLAYSAAYWVTTGYLCPAHNPENLCTDNDAQKDNMTDFELSNNEIYCSVCDDTNGMCGESDAYDQTIDTSGRWCDCWSLQMSVDFKEYSSSHDKQCVGGSGAVVVKPAITNDRSQCTCFRNPDETTQYYQVLRDDLPTVATTYKDDIIGSGITIDDDIVWAVDEVDNTDYSHCQQQTIYYLTNEDFSQGTLRISECGTYVITEDIIFNFNAPSEDEMNSESFSPNRHDLEDLYWFPTTDQSENGDYFGLTQFYGPYALGFFAGLTIETNYVTVDLNGHTLSMDYRFYLQQRFFSLIQLSNKPFQTRQGPTNFGITEDLTPKSVIIKNGVLGLSSHHGIHGRDAADTQILNIQVKDFDVTGIQCNGCVDLVIKDCVVGPQNTNIPTLGRYTQARALLPRVRYLVENYGDSEITFANRGGVSTTIEELADELVEQMDMVYDYIINDVDFDNPNINDIETQIQWQKAKSLFINDDGWQDGGSSYGILINGQGTAVVCIGRRRTHTARVTIENVEIFGIASEPREKTWTSGDQTLVRGFMFDTMDEFNEIVSDDAGYYIGTAYSDIVFAANKVMTSSSDECVYGDLYYTSSLNDWIFVSDENDVNGHTLSQVETDHEIMYSCGSDIQSHVSKGAIGLRIDGTQEFTVENVYIHDIVNWGDLGMDKCGNYSNTEMEKGVAADPDIQYGYTGTCAHGFLMDYANGTIENMTVANVESYNGLAIGMAIYKGSEAKFYGNFDISNIVAGSQLKQSKLDELSLPNANPFVCSFYVGDNTWDPTEDYPSLIGVDLTVIVHTDGIDDVTTSDIYGEVSCVNDRRIGDMDVDGIGYDWTKLKNDKLRKMRAEEEHKHKQQKQNNENKQHRPVAQGQNSKKPNIVVFLTDDQDLLLNSVKSMPYVSKMFVENGLQFSNAFSSSPVCCVSRSTILTGMYTHNHGTFNQSRYGGCYDDHFVNKLEPIAFNTYLYNNGYKTMFSGKYINEYCSDKDATDGYFRNVDISCNHVPPGWNEWFVTGGGAKYYDYSLSWNGNQIDHEDDPDTDYFPELQAQHALDWLDQINNDQDDSPFMMFISTPSAHSPYTPSAKYESLVYDESITAPTNLESFNYVDNSDKGPVLRSHTWGSLTDSDIEFVDLLYRMRHATLLTVDDMINEVYNKIDSMNELENTYFFYLADHGYHLGQYGFLKGKKLLYETDIRIPFYVNTPQTRAMAQHNIEMRQQQHSVIASTVDLGPTIVELALGYVPDTMDGRSLLSHFTPWKVEKRFNSNGDSSDNTRQDQAFLIEYYGESGYNINPAEIDYDSVQINEMFQPDPPIKGLSFTLSNIDSWNNTYQCVRYFDSDSLNLQATPNDDGDEVAITGEIYCKYTCYDNFHERAECLSTNFAEYYGEYYNFNTDPSQTKNQINELTTERHVFFDNLLYKLLECQGHACNEYRTLTKNIINRLQLIKTQPNDQLSSSKMVKDKSNGMKSRLSEHVPEKSLHKEDEDVVKVAIDKSGVVDMKSLPSTCIGLHNGIHWLQLLEPSYINEKEFDYPPVLVQCHDNYMVINTDLDSNLEKYFNSFELWHKSVAGPSNDNRLNWEEWFIPDAISANDFDYVISPNCMTCDEKHERQLYEKKTTYWMTSRFYGCFWRVTGSHNCDMDWDTSECYACLDWHKPTLENRVAITHDTNDASLFDYTGLCSHSVQKSTHYIPETHDQCATWESFYDSAKFHLKPALGTKNSWCQCVKPSSTEHIDTSIYEIPAAMFEIYKNEWEGKQKAKLAVDTEISEDDKNNVYYLYQSDFDSGTYRIQKPGKYIVMEDIAFDFAPNTRNPNAPGAYWPTRERDAEAYPGAGNTRDAYNLGWFAGVTIESNDVELDLNSHKLYMSDYFYYQQRWFTIIEIGSQYFLPGQGIANFGANPATPENVVIKNGVLGLSSHHGIHGNCNKNLLIDNVDVTEFESHGIQLNGFHDITITNVNIGPTSNKAFFQGTYAQARGLIHRYRDMTETDLSEEDVTKEIRFYSRQDKPTNFKKIVDRLESAMDFAFDYVTKGLRSSDIDDPELRDLFEEAVILFVNKNGLPEAGTQYGIFLNTFGASVMTYNLYSDFYSTNAVLKNINIHGMKHEFNEYVRMKKYPNGEESFNPFNGPLNFRYLIGVGNYDKLLKLLRDQKNGINMDAIDADILEYQGNALYDAIVVSNLLSDNWGFLQVQNILNSFMVKWALDGISAQSEWDPNSKISVLGDALLFGCNSDVMFHTGKGTQGLRLDGIQNVQMENINVYDNSDLTPLGHPECGDYDNEEISYYQFKFENRETDDPNDKIEKTLGILYSGHHRMTPPMQVGFSGNMNQGININAAKNVYIKDVSVNNLVSKTGPVFGVSIWPATEITFDGNIDVNNLFAGYDIADGEYTYEDRPNKASEVCAVRIYEEYNNYYASISVNDDVSFSSQCISGHIGCLGDDDTLHYYLSTDEIDNDVTTCTNNYNELNSNDGMNYVKVANIMKNANIADDLKIHVNSEEVSTNSMFNIDWSSNLHDGIFLAEFIMVICGSLGIIVLFLARNYSNKLKRKQSEYRLL